jgi:hypothetical protein
MLALDGNAGLFQFEAHFVANVLEAVGRRDGEVTFLRANLVAEVWKFFAAAVPMSFRAVDEMEGRIAAVAVTDLVEDKELRFRPEERGVRDAGALQIRLRFFRDAARVAIVRLARDRIDDRANKTERRLGVENIDPRRARIGDPRPSVKISSLYSVRVVVKCCQEPGRSVNLKSTSFTSWSLIILLTSEAVLSLAIGIGMEWWS